MTTITILTELEALVRDERRAIVAFDGEAVLDLAARKEALLAQMTSDGTQVDLRVDRERFAALASELRHNGILLAHARDCIKEAIEILRAKPTAGRLSVTA